MPGSPVSSLGCCSWGGCFWRALLATCVGRTILVWTASTHRHLQLGIFIARLQFFLIIVWCSCLHLHIMKASAAGPDLPCLQEVWGAVSPCLLKALFLVPLLAHCRLTVLVFILSSKSGSTAQRARERRRRINPPPRAPRPRTRGESQIKRLKLQTENPLGLLMRSERLAAKPNSHSGGAVLRALSLTPELPAPSIPSC